MKKRLMAALLILPLCLTLLVGMALAAGSVPDLTKPLGLTVEMKHSGTPLANVNVTIYRVANMTVADDVWRFELTTGFSGSNADVSRISSAAVNLALGATLRDYAVKNNLTGQMVATNTSGQAVFSIGTAGLYLVVPGSATGYYDMDPYLVSVPGMNGDAWVYTVTAVPKTELKPEPTTTATTTTATTTTNTPTTTTEAEEITTTTQVTTTAAVTTTTTAPTTTTQAPTAPTTATEASTTIRPTYISPVDDPDIPVPTTIRPGNVLVPDGDVYLELDEDGTPLGEWRWDPENGWEYEEFEFDDPLAQLPQTGVLRWPVQAMAGAGVLLFGAGWAVLKSGKKHDEA